MTSTAKLASSAILERDGRLLLVRRANPPAADMFAFPGGRAEPGEGPQETAIREFYEETALHVTNPVLFETYDLVTRDSDGSVASHFFLSVFLVESDDDADPVAGDDASEIGWYTPEEIRALPIPDSVRECVDRLALRTAPSTESSR